MLWIWKFEAMLSEAMMTFSITDRSCWCTAPNSSSFFFFFFRDQCAMKTLRLCHFPLIRIHPHQLALETCHSQTPLIQINVSWYSNATLSCIWWKCIREPCAGDVVSVPRGTSEKHFAGRHASAVNPLRTTHGCKHNLQSCLYNNDAWYCMGVIMHKDILRCIAQ